MVSPKNSPSAEPDAETQRVLQDLHGEDEKENEPTKEIDIDTVQERLEALLSKQNLAEDAFIQQHMNAQMYIPLTILLRHRSLQILGDEAAVLPTAKAAAQRSEKVGVDEDGTMVRPLLKPRRNTLILHDLPEAFPEDELKALFDGSPESESFCSLKPDVNNTAFVSFKTDEAAQNAALWLRSQKLQGAEIKCAVKSEHFVRSFFPASTGPSMQASSPYMMPHQAWGYSPWMSVHGGWPSSPEHFGDPSMGWGDGGGWMQQDGSPGSFQRDGKGDGGKGKNPKGKGKGRKRGSLGGSFSQDSQMETGSDFSSPQLPPSNMGFDQEPFQEGLAEPGYTHEYRKYSRQYIIETCNATEDSVKPESYEKCEKNGVLLFRSSPCKDWAPLPTPMTTFASNFFDERRGSDAQEGDGQGKGERAGRKASWGPSMRGSRSDSHDYNEDSEWAHGDTSWWKPGAAGDNSKRGRSASNSKSWGEGKSWDYKQSDAGYGEKQWVKKEDKAAQEAEWDESSGPRKMSWAEKVKGVESSDRPQRWVAKNKPGEEAKSKEKDGGANAAPGTDSEAAAAAPATGGDEAPSAASPAAPAAAAAEPTAEAAAATPAAPTWADRARKSASK